MPLFAGTRLGHYDVTALLGEGGMGEVWQARDTTLDRDVALKVLPHAFTADPDRLARFEWEAKVLASLNRPNIAATHGLEESAGIRFTHFHAHTSGVLSLQALVLCQKAIYLSFQPSGF